MEAGTLSSSDPQKLSTVSKSFTYLEQISEGTSYTTALCCCNIDFISDWMLPILYLNNIKKQIKRRMQFSYQKYITSIPSVIFSTAMTISPVNPARLAEPRNNLKSFGLEQVEESVPLATEDVKITVLVLGLWGSAQSALLNLISDGDIESSCPVHHWLYWSRPIKTPTQRERV